MYTKMSLELVLQGLCRFFFLFFFFYILFYIKGFTSAVGLQFLQLLVEEIHSLAGSFITAAWSSHLNTSPPSTPPLHRRVHIVGITWTTWETHVRVSCWDMSDSAVFCCFFFFFPLSDNSDGRATPGKLHSRPWNKCVKMCNHKECALCFSYEPHKSSLLATLSLS